MMQWLSLLRNFIQQILNSTSLQFQICAEIFNGENLWQWTRLGIFYNTFRRSTIPQKQFVITIIIIIIIITNIITKIPSYQNNYQILLSIESENHHYKPYLKLTLIILQKHSSRDTLAGNYMFKINNRNIKTRCEICSKLTITTQE